MGSTSPISFCIIQKIQPEQREGMAREGIAGLPAQKCYHLRMGHHLPGHSVYQQLPNFRIPRTTNMIFLKDKYICKMIRELALFINMKCTYLI